MYTGKEEMKLGSSGRSSIVVHSGVNLGDTIQDYTIVKLLGKGGFGHVYEAQSKLGDGQQKVAIKMVSHHLPPTLISHTVVVVVITK
jgi:serine/threonine protein kinase